MVANTNRHILQVQDKYDMSGLDGFRFGYEF